MAIQFADNIDFQGRKPDFTRQEYEHISDFLTVRDSKMPQMYLAYCLEDRQIYLYDKTNGVSDVTGKFRLFQSGGSSIQVTEMPQPTEAFLGKVVQYIGVTDETYTKGFFYECESVTVEEETTYLWKSLSVQKDPLTISTQEIDELF